jgi:hypothetical protein
MRSLRCLAWNEPSNCWSTWRETEHPSSPHVERAYSRRRLANGLGATHKLLRAGIDLSRVRHVFFTPHHANHPGLNDYRPDIPEGETYGYERYRGVRPVG